MSNLLPRLYYKYYSRHLKPWTADGYYSQYGQDKLIEKLLPGLTNGVFVDIGAHDGVTFSNTYYLEKLGWTGLAIEPMDEVFTRLTENRTCQTVKGCVGPVTGKVKFRRQFGYTEMLSGIISEYDPRHLERIQDDLNTHGGSSEDIEVNCFRLNDLLDRFEIRHIDYLNIDVEGGELAVLNALDFSRVHISIIGVENIFFNYRIPRLLDRKGFDLRYNAGPDGFYLNRSIGFPHTAHPN